MWAACESVVMDWATGYNGLLLGSTGCDDVRELCTDLKQSLAYSWFLALSFFRFEL